MEARKIIEELVDIRIDFENQFSDKITFGNIKKAKGISDSDEVFGVTVRSGFAPSWGGEQDDYYRYPVIIVKNKRPETDDEYFTRLKKEEADKKVQEERDRLEYLRLKAKFE